MAEEAPPPTTEEPPRPAVTLAASDHRITLGVISQDGNETFFKISINTPFEKMFAAYCSARSMPRTNVRFVYDGNRIGAAQTPAALGMHEGDQIDALMEQTGG